MQTVLMTLVMFFAISCTPSAPVEKGTVLGTVAYVSNGEFVREVKDATVVVSNGREIRIKANQQGDFDAKLEVGKWSLVRVLDESNAPLTLDDAQARSLTLSKGQNSRFDIIVRASSTK